MLPLLRALLEFGVGDWSFLAFVVTTNWTAHNVTIQMIGAVGHAKKRLNTGLNKGISGERKQRQACPRAIF